jgi:hypothetical protein
VHGVDLLADGREGDSTGSNRRHAIAIEGKPGLKSRPGLGLRDQCQVDAETIVLVDVLSLIHEQVASGVSAAEFRQVLKANRAGRNISARAYAGHAIWQNAGFAGKLKKKWTIDRGEQPAPLMERVVGVANASVEAAHLETKSLAVLVMQQNTIDDRQRGEIIGEVEVNVSESRKAVGQTGIKKYIQVIHLERGFVPGCVASLQANVTKHANMDASQLETLSRHAF